MFRKSENMAFCYFEEFTQGIWYIWCLQESNQWKPMEFERSWCQKWKGNKHAPPSRLSKCISLMRKKNGKPNKTKRNKINFMSNLKSATPFIVSSFGALVQKPKIGRKNSVKSETRRFSYGNASLWKTSKMCVVTVCVFFLFTNLLILWMLRVKERIQKNAVHVLSDVGIEERREKNLRELKRIMISNKIRFISMKIRLQIQTLFSSFFLSFRYKFDFGKLNAFAVRWTRMGIHVIPLSKARAFSLSNSPSIYLSIFFSVCTYVACSFCFRSMQKSISAMQHKTNA